MKHNLSKRLFTITLSLLLGLIASTFIFQVFFFESFYEKKKMANLIKEINRFRNMYSYELEDNIGIGTALQSFETSTNSKIGIFSPDGVLKVLPDKNAKDSYDSLILQEFFNQLISEKELLYKVITTGTTQSTIFYDKDNGDKKIGVISPMSLNSKNDSIVLSFSSIQPIEEASDVISEFYAYIFIGFIFISILLSSIYSNLISKPLINIDKVAKKMSKMDFTEKCLVDREDEIGSLATTLNFLSSNLANALTDLQEKNKKLEEDIEKERNLEVMRKDFIASVSHELKTPIGIIEGYAEGIKDGIVSGDDTLRYLETIIDESQKMSVLVSNMLELSKLESGVLKPKPEVFNINRLIKKVVNKHSIDANEENLNLYFNECTNYSYVNADVFQMEQVLTNLITNAIKYTPEGNDIIVSISEDNNRYKISIINFGVQLDLGEIDKLFNKFYRVDKARKRSTNSTGLGLSIVKNILDLHNFEYSFNNIENGVEFSYYLPIEILSDDENYID
ncbi:ATP-binding protein [Clostridium sp. LP20]|uniref:sensor histidine kinase n=1 Tax=Clostridium sp. LP20 TaxID=3418665 RepID=UPI003EE43859